MSNELREALKELANMDYLWQHLILKEMTKTSIESIRKDTNSLILNGWTNSVKCSQGKAEHDFHKVGKWKVCQYLFKHSIDFRTEVTFRNGKRADIVVLDWGLGIEILHSETPKEFRQKIKEYPIPCIALPSTVLNKEVEEVMDDLKAMNGTNYDYYQKHIVGLKE